jgi:hypothetical protein
MAEEMLMLIAEILLNIVRDNIFCGQPQEKVQKVICFATGILIGPGDWNAEQPY